MSDLLVNAFSLVCGRIPGHVWAPGGCELPFCQRCTGLYLGACCAVALLAVLRPRVNGRFLWVNAALILFMVPFGFHLVPQGPLLRTLSGALFAFGVTGLLWVLPSGEWRTAHGEGRTETGLVPFLGAMAGSVAILLVAAWWGGRAGAQVLTALGVMGALAFVLLALVNVVLTVRMLTGRTESRAQTA